MTIKYSNFNVYEDKINICHGDHHRSQDCEWEIFVDLETKIWIEHLEIFDNGLLALSAGRLFWIDTGTKVIEEMIF